MNNDTQFNHKMITHAREYRGITQTELSQKIVGLSQGNLSRAEKGTLSLSGNIYVKIATELNFPINFFLKNHTKTPINEFYYRKRKSIPKKVLTALEAKLNLYRLVIDDLLDSLDISSNIPEYDISSGITPEVAAQKLRTYWNIKSGPIENLIKILESNGIIIQFIDSDTDKFDGITMLTDKNQVVMFINSNAPNDRKRFTIGHELGHLVLHILPKDPPSKNRDVEMEANRFSAEFNAPENVIYNQLLGIKFRDFRALKEQWNMSMAFLILRAKTLGIISKSKATNFMIELSRRGWRVNEPGLTSLDEPKLLEELLTVHVEQLGYSKSELIDLFGISFSDYKDLFNDSEEGKIISIKSKIV